MLTLGSSGPCEKTQPDHIQRPHSDAQAHLKIGRCSHYHLTANTCKTPSQDYPVKFSSVQSLSHLVMSDSLRPHGLQAACQASLSTTSSWLFYMQRIAFQELCEILELFQANVIPLDAPEQFNSPLSLCMQQYRENRNTESLWYKLQSP